MSEEKPASVNAASIAGRSPFSQRGEDAESGRITQARVEPVASSEELEQPVRTSAADVANATNANAERFFICSHFLFLI
jgi:hypothetical protein